MSAAKRYIAQPDGSRIHAYDCAQRGGNHCDCGLDSPPVVVAAIPDSALHGVDARLERFLAAMRYKLYLRARRPPDPTKWPVDGVDSAGNRDWRRTGTTFLNAKLDEEVAELKKEVTFTNALLLPTPLEYERVALEAADVALVAFMLAEAAGVDFTQPFFTQNHPSGVSTNAA